MVAAIIVIYHPNLPLLDRLLRSILGQVEMIFIVDNTPDASDNKAVFLSQYNAPIRYKPLGDNRGIAFAQNAGIREALNQKCTHILLLDQDSALPSDAIKALLAAEDYLIHSDKKVAAVGPAYVDEKSGKRSDAVLYGWCQVTRTPIPSTGNEPIKTDSIIASGSLIRASVFGEVGLMRDELFIDWVDVEWCCRARTYGLDSYVTPSVTMVHSVGDTAVRILGRDINLHSNIRNYYIIRNATYLLWDKSMGWRWRLYILRWIPKYSLLRLFLSRSKWKTFKLLSAALLSGLVGTMGRYDEK